MSAPVEASSGTPIYLDWDFWIAIGTIGAIVLSQLPPVRTWFRKAKLEIELYVQGELTHKVGYPNIQLHIILRNIGAKIARIKEINISIEKDGKHLVDLPARSFRSPSDQREIVFVPFNIQAGQEFGYVVKFFKFLSREERKLLSELDASLRKDLIEKMKLLTEEDKKKQVLVYGEDANVKPIVNIFDKNFVWTAGEYNFRLSVKTHDEKSDINTKYRFTLFESDEAYMRRLVEEYNTGAGVNFDSANHKWTIIELTKTQ